MDKKFNLSLVFTMVFFLTFLLFSTPALAWYSGYSDWQYRKEITITEQSGNTLTDYQLAINITYDSDMNSDFNDIRFTWYNESSGEEQEIPYWIEDKVDSSWAYVWVKVPEIHANGNTTIYMYYGNPSAESESNGTATFIGYAEDKWTTYELEGTWDFNMRYVWKINISTNTARATSLQVFDTNYADSIVYTKIDGGDIYYYTGSSWQLLLDSNLNVGPLYRIEFDVKNGVYRVCVEEIGCSAYVDSISTPPCQKVRSSDDDSNPEYIKYVFVTKYTDPEPTYSIGTEEANISNQPPQITIYFPENKTYHNNNIVFNFSASDDNSTIFHIKAYLNDDLIYDNSSYHNNTLVILERFLGDGTYNFTVWANDSNSEYPQTSISSVIFTVKTYNITIYSPQNTTYTNTADLKFKVIWNKTSFGVLAYLDESLIYQNSSYTNNTNVTLQLSSLSGGPHKVKVKINNTNFYEERYFTISILEQIVKFNITNDVLRINVSANSEYSGLNSTKIYIDWGDGWKLYNLTRGYFTKWYKNPNKYPYIFYNKTSNILNISGTVYEGGIYNPNDGRYYIVGQWQPSVIYFNNSFYMALEMYNSSDNTRRTLILKSNDGFTWESTGIWIDDSNCYNSDTGTPSLYYNPDYNPDYVYLTYYCYDGSGSNFRIRNTTDMTTWSDSIEIFHYLSSEEETYFPVPHLMHNGTIVFVYWYWNPSNNAKGISLFYQYSGNINEQVGTGNRNPNNPILGSTGIGRNSAGIIRIWNYTRNSWDYLLYYVYDYNGDTSSSISRKGLVAISWDDTLTWNKFENQTDKVVWENGTFGEYDFMLGVGSIFYYDDAYLMYFQQRDQRSWTQIGVSSMWLDMYNGTKHWFKEKGWRTEIFWMNISYLNETLLNGIDYPYLKVKVVTYDYAGGSVSDTYTIYEEKDTTPPTIQFISQTPPDVSTTNILGKYLNITYSITDPSGVNASTVNLYYKTNSSTSEIVWYINGTAYSGWQIAENYTNSSSIWYFYLDHQIYPGTYNLPDSLMKNAPKEHFSLDNKNEILKIRFFNVSNDKEFNYLVLNARNQTTNTEFLRIYYCNESYSTGDPEDSPYCVEFYDLEPTALHNYTRDSSLYWIIPLPINKSTGYLANVYVTPTSYILLRDSASAGGWNISYVTNISRPDTVQYSSNNGHSYSNFAGTVDMYIHQFSGSDSLWYYVCANDTFGNSNCSEIRQDLIQIDNLPPSSPDVYNPTEGYYRGLITINYTQSISPNAYPIVNYTIDLVDLNENFVQKIADNDLKLSYVWNSSEAPDGKYFIRVRACDNLTQCSYGYSENITIDNTKPFVEIISPQNTTYTTNTITLSFNATDANLNRVWYSLNDGTNITITGSTILILDNGNYKLTLYADDKAGNENSSTVYFKVSIAPAPAPAPAPSEGVVYIPSENETVYFPTLNMTIKFPITIIPKEKMILIIEKDGKILFNQTIEKPTEIELPKGNYTFIFKNDKGDKMVRYLQVNSPTFFEVSIAGKTFKQVEKPSPSIDYALIAKIVIVLGIAYLIYIYWDKIKDKLEEVAWQLKLVK